MKARNNSKGGRHVAGERGFRPNGQRLAIPARVAGVGIDVPRPAPAANCAGNRSCEGPQAMRGMSPRYFLGPDFAAAAARWNGAQFA